MTSQMLHVNFNDSYNFHCFIPEYLLFTYVQQFLCRQFVERVAYGCYKGRTNPRALINRQAATPGGCKTRQDTPPLIYQDIEFLTCTLPERRCSEEVFLIIWVHLSSLSAGNGECWLFLIYVRYFQIALHWHFYGLGNVIV